MNRLRLSLTIVSLCAPLGARAMDAPPPPPPPTYRIVSPDGKVTYSDRKPTDEKLQTRQLGHAPPTAPLFTPGTSLFEPPRPGAVAGDLTPPRGVTGKPFPPGLPDAVLSVLGHQFYVQTLVETCGRSTPAAMERYQTVVRNWRDRNADILGRSNRITFALFTGEQRDLLRTTARSRLERLLAPPDASDAERALWCDHAADDIVHRRLELVGDAHLAPVANYEAN